MSILKIAQIGHPLLRAQARPVDDALLADPKLAQLVGDLVDTMREYQGVGLAAPQVRAPVRVFVMEVDTNERYPGRVRVPLQVVLNPQIEPLSNEVVNDWEGCLSIAGLRGRVPRWPAVRLRGLTPRGESFELELEGFAARVVQHEADHLDGVVFLDRMPDLHSLTAEEEFRRLKADVPEPLSAGG